MVCQSKAKGKDKDNNNNATTTTMTKHTCKYCGDHFKNPGGLGGHRLHCKANPNKKEFRENFAAKRQKTLNMFQTISWNV